MSERGDVRYLRDMEEAIQRIRDYTYGIEYDDFLDDIKTQDAVLRNIEIIGEAVKQISYACREEHPDIEWRKLAGMRDKIIHFYFGINWDIVWGVVTTKLPDLAEQVKRIRQEAGG